MPKVLFLIADGMGDWPMEDLDGKTVLAVARTPRIDALAGRGLAGLCRTVPPGLPPGSDVANMALLGYDPRAHHTGRGPIEAAAQGLELAPDDLVWRANLVSVSEFSAKGRMLDYSSGHIDTPAAHAVIAELNASLPALREALHAEGGGLQLIPGVQYRHLLVQRGAGHGPDADLAISPPHDITDKPIGKDYRIFQDAPALAPLLNQAAARLAQPWNTSKARALWPWGQGRPLHLPSFQEKFGLRGAVISAVDLIKGLGRAAGMDVLHVNGATGLLDTNYEGKVQAALEFLRQGGDFAFVHVEAPDECGHAGATDDKIESIQRFDAQVVGPLVDALPEAVFLVACDHLTPLCERTHVPDPVPFLLAWPDCREPMGLSTFSEATAGGTGLILETGHELLPWALRTAGIRP